MNRFIHIPFFCFAMAVTIFASTACSRAQGLEFETEKHDFGSVKQGEKAVFAFKYKNTGKDTVMLQQPKASCGCTAALLSKPIVAPGDTGRVQVEYNAYPGVIGHISKSVSIFRAIANENKQIAVLHIEGEVTAEIAADPKIIQFETLMNGKVKSIMTLVSRSEQTLKLDNVSASLLAYIDTTEGNQYHADKVIAKPFTNFTMSVRDKELAPGASTELTLELTTESKGQINGSVRIVLPHSELRIPVVGVVLRSR